MRRIFTILMLLCTISTFAAGVTSTYSGKLTVSVDGATPTVVDPQSVKVIEDGTAVKMTISNFSYAGLTADVNITASKNLSTGGVDAVILDYAVAKNYVDNSGFKMIDQALLEEENLIISKKGNTELMNAVNKALDEFVGSDKYNELKEKWGA